MIQLWLMKRTSQVRATLNSEEIKPVASAVSKLHLPESTDNQSISQSVENLIFDNNFFEGL